MSTSTRINHHSFQGTCEFEKWTQEGFKHLKELERATFFPTRFACRDIMFEMGIQDQVDDLVDRMNLGRLTHMDYLTYPEPTRHFLAMVNFIEDEVNGHGYVYFMVGPTQYSLTFSDFCEVYRFPSSTFSATQEFREASTVWRNITTDGSFSTASCMSKVRNQTIHYALCLLANTVYARHKRGVPTTNELRMLYCVIRYWLHNHHGRPIEYDPIFHLDAASMFLGNLLHIRNELYLVDNLKVYIRGMLTPLFDRVGVNLDLYRPLPERPKMDFEYLVLTHTLAAHFPNNTLAYRFMDKDERNLCCFLPNPRYCNTSCFEDLKFSISHWLTFALPPPQDYNSEHF